MDKKKRDIQKVKIQGLDCRQVTKHIFLVRLEATDTIVMMLNLANNTAVNLYQAVAGKVPRCNTLRCGLVVGFHIPKNPTDHSRFVQVKWSPSNKVSGVAWRQLMLDEISRLKDGLAFLPEQKTTAERQWFQRPGRHRH